MVPFQGKALQLNPEFLQHLYIETLKVYTLGDSVDYEPYETTRQFYYGCGFEEFRRIVTDNPSCPEELHLKKTIER